MVALSPRRRVSGESFIKLQKHLGSGGQVLPDAAFCFWLFQLSLLKVQGCFPSMLQTLQVNDSIGPFCYHLPHNRINRL